MLIETQCDPGATEHDPHKMRLASLTANIKISITHRYILDMQLYLILSQMSKSSKQASKKRKANYIAEESLQGFETD